MKNQWRVIVGILLVLVVVLFAVANNMTVPINFGFATLKAPLILIIIGSAFLGAIIVFLVSTSTMFQQKKELKNLRKELTDFQQNNDEKLREQREALEREYANKQADLALREQQLAEVEAQMTPTAVDDSQGIRRQGDTFLD
jgi:putative membrane protein